MAHNVHGFVGHYADLANLTHEAGGATLAPLASEYGLLVDRGWVCNIEDGGPSEELLALGARLRARAPVALIATAYFGGSGGQGAAAWSSAESLCWKTVKGSINEALRLLGVEKGERFDEFDAVGLGWYRSNEDWMQFARDGRLHWEKEQRPEIAAAFAAAEAARSPVCAPLPRLSSGDELEQVSVRTAAERDEGA